MKLTELRLPPPVARLTARPLGRVVLTPAVPWDVQRRRLDRIMGSSPLPRGTSIEPTTLTLCWVAHEAACAKMPTLSWLPSSLGLSSA